MVYFFILPLWILAVLLGIALLFFPKLRFLSLHIIFGSTWAIILSALGLLAALLIFAGISSEVTNWHSWQRLGDIGSYVGGGLGLLAILGGFAAGALLGGLLGLALAWWINLKLQWSHRPLLAWFSERLDQASSKLANR
jgi:hypothetical protein